MATPGSSAISYQLGEEPVVQISGHGSASEEEAGSLRLEIACADPARGAMRVAICVQNYADNKLEYDAASSMVEVHAQNPDGAWLSTADSTLTLRTRKMRVGGLEVYIASLRAENLAWQGEGTPDALSISWMAFSVCALSDFGDPINVTTEGGFGAGSITYTFGSNPQQIQSVEVTTTSFFNNGIIYAVQLLIEWVDPIMQSCQVWLQASQFTGTGTFSCYVLVSSSKTSPGNWNNYGTLDVIYSQSGNNVSWDGSLIADNLAWQDGPAQPDVNLHMTALTFTVRQG